MNNVNFSAQTGIRLLDTLWFIFTTTILLLLSILVNIHIIFFSEFHIGVTIFFVLNVFLICNCYFDNPNFNFKNYLFKRIARIYPIYFILTTLTFVSLLN